MTGVPAESTILRAAGSADFLAALPRLTGMRAPDSAYVVFFGVGEDSSRTLGAARIDLPSDAQLSDLSASAGWAEQVAGIAHQAPGAGSVVIVIDTEQNLTELPASSPAGFMSMLLIGAAEDANIEFRDLLAQAPDGWAEMLLGRRAELRALDEITSSALHDPMAQQQSLEEWRAQHPDQTSEDPKEILHLAERMTVATQSQVKP